MSSPKPTRVIFCITELDPGGAERALTQLVTGLDRNEWQPSVVCLGPRGYFTDVLEQSGIPVLCLNAKGVSSFPRVLRQLIREFRTQKPAIVQTFLFHANILGRIAAWFARVPIVVSGIRVAERRNRWHGWLDRLTNVLVKTNVCVSNGVAKFAKEQMGLDPKKLVVIPNSVDYDRFANAKPIDRHDLGVPEDSTVFISIGRLEYQKGIDVLLRAIEQLQPIAANVHFLMVGDGPDRNALQSQAAQQGLSSHVHFLGRREDVPGLLASSTALILSSRWEGMPNVVLEAMAAGLPIVTTNVEGIEELVQHGRTGIVVPNDSPESLAEAIRRITSDSDFAATAGKLSQEFVSKQFTTIHTVQSYVNLYRSLLRD